MDERIAQNAGRQAERRSATPSAGWSFLGGLTFKQLAARMWHEASADNASGHAAELAFYFLLAFFPLLIFLLSVLGFWPEAQQLLVKYLAQAMPPEATELMRSWVKNVASQSSGGLLSFSLLASLWAASSGLSALMGVLNVAYEVEEGRPWWKARLVAIGLVLALTVFVLGGALLIIFGDKLAAWLAGWFGLGAVFTTVWPYVDYLIGLVLLTFGIGVIYYYAPNVDLSWRWLTPGAIFAVVMAVLASLLFSLYLNYGPGYSATYGSLGAVVVLMLWLYLLSLAIFMGGEINSEVERAAGRPIRQKENHSQRDEQTT
jgi:membrane protein